MTSATASTIKTGFLDSTTIRLIRFYFFYLIDSDLSQQIEVTQHLSGTQYHARQWIFSQGHWQASFLANSFVEIFDERAAPGQHNATVSDVGGKFWRCAFQHNTDRIDDDVDAFIERFSDLFIGNRHALGHTFHQVPSFDFHRSRRIEGVCGADLDLDLFRGAFPDQQIVFAFDVLGDGFVHLVSRGLVGTAVNHSGQRDYRNFRGASSDVDNHVSRRFGDGQSGADCRCHRLLDKVSLARLGAVSGILNGPLLNLGNTRGHTNHDSWMDKHLPAVCFLN